MTHIPPPTPAPGAMTMDQIIDSRTPPPSPALIEARAILAADQRAKLMAASRASIAREPIEPPTNWPPFDPSAPDNNTMPAASSVTYFGMSGRRATSLHEISFLANAIGRENYPVNTTTIYENVNRPLTQMEADFLNGVTP